MSLREYFFLICLGTVAVARVMLVWSIKGPTVGGLRVRHYMYGVVLLVVGFFTHLIFLFAIGWGLFIDELPVIIARGFGLKDEQWHGCEDCHTKWAVAGVFILLVLTFIFRSTLSEFVLK